MVFYTYILFFRYLHMNFSKKFFLFLIIFSTFLSKSYAISQTDSQDNEGTNIVEGLRTLLDPNWIINLF